MIRLVKARSAQVIVATHSVEIMAEVQPSDILVIDRDRPRSDFASTQPAVQALIDRIGGIHNIHLARLWRGRRCLFVEGKDIQYFKVIQDLLYPASSSPIDSIPNMPIGGWSGWPHAVGTALFIHNAFGDDISVYCVLDSDYHTLAQIQQRYDDAAAKNARLHIWSRKEIENYLLLPEVIARAVAQRTPAPGRAPTATEIAARITNIAEELRDATQDAYADAFLSDDRRGGITNANRKARQVVERAFATVDGRISAVSGKDVLSRLSAWTQAEFGVSFGPHAIIRTMTVADIHEEVRQVVRAIETSQVIRHRPALGR
jgi:hypothetical protein